MTWEQLGITAGAGTAIIAFGYTIGKVIRSFWSGFKAAVHEATQDIRDELASHGRKADARHAENIERFVAIEGDLVTVKHNLRQHMKDAAEAANETKEMDADYA